MAGRRPDQNERAIWRAAMRDVRPLAGGAEIPIESPSAPMADAPRRARDAKPGRPNPADAPLPMLAHGAAPGLDRRNAERLKRGQLPIEARLDLHGMTQKEAHRALESFLARAHEAGRRCVLVVTGKSGVLRSAVPRWLNEQPTRPRLIAFMPARPKDGGEGALYVLLRRPRPREG
jgi:DNA-nicking Smr family endonuclease